MGADSVPTTGAAGKQDNAAVPISHRAKLFIQRPFQLSAKAYAQACLLYNQGYDQAKCAKKPCARRKLFKHVIGGLRLRL
jgi:hypothetical protein